MSLWLVFLMLSGVFSLGWALGSALGYQNGQRHAQELAQLETDLVGSPRQAVPA